MPQVALTSDQLISLRGTTSVASRFVNRVRISVTPNTVKYSMRINQATFDNSFAQITYDGGSGTLANVLTGMRVIISHTNDITAGYWEGIVRKTPTSTILYLNENSYDFTDNDYCWILEDFAIKDKLARQVSSVQYNYWDIAHRQLLPVIYGLKTVYAGDIASGTNVLTLSLAPSALAATSGASISSWSWNVGDGTITVGSSSTQNITCTWPEGHRYIHLTVTDSGGRVSVFHSEVHAHGSTYVYQLMAVQDIQITGNVANGYDASLTNFVGVAGLLNMTQITMWSDDTYQTGDGALTGDNIIFVGRIRTRDNQTAASEPYNIDKSATYSVEGALTQLSHTVQLAFEMLNVASPTKWGDIKNLTIWRGIVYLLSEYSTFLELHSLQFDSTADTFLAPTRNPNGDILAAVNDLALSINAALQISPNGQAEVVRAGNMLEDTADRDALVTRAPITTSDLTSISIKQDGVRPVGLLNASGGSYNSTTGLYTVVEVNAPGLAQDSGSQAGTLARQVLPANLSQAAANTRLKIRANDAFEKMQEVDRIDATFAPGWYSALIPSLNTWYTFTCAAEVTVDGAVTGKTVLTTATRWLLTNVELGLNAEGVPEVKGTFIKETRGITKGYVIQYPPPTSSTLPSYPSTPSVPMFPVPPIYLPDTPTGDEIPVPVTINLPLDGNAWIVGGENDGTQTLLLTTTMLQLASPYTRDIVPDDLGVNEVIKEWKCNPFGDKRSGYLLTYDEVLLTSRVWYTEDFTAAPVIYSQGETFIGLYTELRLGDENGQVTVLGGEDGATGGDSSVWVKSAVGSGVFEEYGAGYFIASAELNGGDGKYHLEVTTENANLCAYLDITVEVGEINLISAWVECGDDPYGTQVGGLFGADKCVNYWGQKQDNPFTLRFALTDCGDALPTTFVTRYSTDYGATVSAAISAGAAASAIDTQKDGTQVLIGSGGQTIKATAGGAYSNYGTAKTQGCLYIPRYHMTTTSANNGANPQFLLFASALDGGESMWVVSSNGTVFDDVSPTSGADVGLSTGSRCLNVHWQTSGLAAHILAIGLFGATRKLAVSLDTGTTWKFSSALNAAAFGIRTQIGSKKVCGWANGAKVGIVKNYTATGLAFVERVFPITVISTLDVVG